MRKKNREKVFPLDNNELHRLCLEDSGIVLRRNVHQYIRVNYSKLPVNSTEFMNAVTKELNKRILRYNSKKKDFILRFINIRIRTPIVANVCRILTVKCITDMFIFKPAVDQIMSAVVNKKSKTHIGCILYDVFNVSIVKSKDVSYNQWLGRFVEMNDKINFRVQKINVEKEIPHVIGDIVTDSDDSASCREIFEKDSVISIDPSSSESHFSDLEDILDTIRDRDNTTKKRKLSFSENDSPVKKKKYC